VSADASIEMPMPTASLDVPLAVSLTVVSPSAADPGCRRDRRETRSQRREDTRHPQRPAYGTERSYNGPDWTIWADKVVTF
jgi:hypothetical protein